MSVHILWLCKKKTVLYRYISCFRLVGTWIRTKKCWWVDLDVSAVTCEWWSLRVREAEYVTLQQATGAKNRQSLSCVKRLLSNELRISHSHADLPTQDNRSTKTHKTQTLNQPTNQPIKTPKQAPQNQQLSLFSNPQKNQQSTNQGTSVASFDSSQSHPVGVEGSLTNSRCSARMNPRSPPVVFSEFLWWNPRVETPMLFGCVEKTRQFY